MDCTNAHQGTTSDYDHALQMSRVEELQIQYADRWLIYRPVQPEGRHGPWTAKRVAGDGQPELQAPSIEALANQLAAAES